MQRVLHRPRRARPRGPPQAAAASGPRGARCAHFALQVVLPLLGCAAPALRTPAELAPSAADPTAAYVLHPGPGRALVVFQDESRRGPVVEYGVTCADCGPTTPVAFHGRVEAQPCEGRWCAELTELPSGAARVSYRIRSKRGVTTGSFKPGALATERFRFAAYGNTYGDIAVHRAIVAAIRSERVDFVIHTGNFVEFPERASQWDAFFREEQPLLSEAPIFPALGAREAVHGARFGAAFVNVVWNDTLTYYAADWGNLRIVTVDEGVACPEGCLELDFVRRALREGAERGMLLMLVSPRPAYSSVAGAALPVLAATLSSLARDFGVELVLSGGAPEYERSKPIEGTVYVVTASAGAPRFPVQPQPKSEVVRVEPSYAVFDVAPDAISLRAVGASGNVIDSALIRPVRAKLAPASDKLSNAMPDPPPATAPPPAPESPPATASIAAANLTTADFQQRSSGSALAYDLLRLPEFLVRLAVTPTFPVVYWADEVALDARVTDILTNDEKTSLLLPTASAFGQDAAGIGFRYTHEALAGRDGWLLAAGQVKTNEDRSGELTYGQSVPALDPLAFEVQLSHGYDHNERYYGIGAASPNRARALLVDETRAAVAFEVGGPASAAALLARTRLAYMRRREAPGQDPALPAVDPSGAPPGFGRAHDFAELTQTLSLDRRDTLGRTGAGTLLELELNAATDVGGAPLDAAGARARATLFVALGGRERVLVLHAGTAAVTPWDGGDDVPLQELVTLGRATYLRGYAERRFRDRTGWWSSVEYRYPLFRYGPAATGASATLFVDAGQVASGYAELTNQAVRYSYGLGVRLETLAALMLRLQLGLSPEGEQLTLSLNEAYAGP